MDAHQRLPFLDALRILAFGLLVLYHTGMAYVSWDWHVKSAYAGAALEPFMRLSSPWRMSLLFFVSGAATAFMFGRDGGATRSLLASRVKRLLVPLAFGVLVVVPPQAYVEVVQRHGYAGTYLDFMAVYLSGGSEAFCAAAGRCLILPTWNHLWFLPYLMAYTALGWLLLRRWPAALDVAADRLRRHRGVMVLMLAPIAWLIVTRLLLRPIFPVTHAFVDDVYSHAQYGVVFVAGAVCARAAVWPRFEALRWVALGTAALGYLGLLLTAPADPLRAVAFAAMQWSAVLAAVGFAHRHLNRPARWLRTASEAVFPVYILHQTAIVLAVAGLTHLSLGAWLEAIVVLSFTLVVCAGGYLAVRRVRWLRPLFGLGPQGGSGSTTDTIHATPKRSVSMP